MAPIKFADLGKNAKDLIGKEFDHKSSKLDLTSRTSNGVSFQVVGTKDNASGKTNATFETKGYVSDLNASLKWTTNNSLTSVLTKKLRSGAKIDFETNLLLGNTTKPATNSALTNALSDLAGEVRAEYTTPTVFVTGSINKVLKIAASASYKSNFGAVAGVALSANLTADKQVVNPGSVDAQYAVAYVDRDFDISAHLLRNDIVMSRVYHRIHDSIQAAAEVGYTVSSKKSTFALGGIYKLDPFTTIKAKIDQDALTHVSLTQIARPGVKLTLASCLNPTTGASTLGFGLVLSA